MPWLQGAAQGQLYAVGFDLPDHRKAELKVRLKPGHVKRVAGLVQLCQNILEVGAYKAWQQKAVVQLGAPARHAVVCAKVGLVPEAGHQRTQQQLLGNAHAGVGRHFKSAQLQQSKSASR